MPKILTIAGLVVSGMLALLFTADLALGIPFGVRPNSWMMDISFLVCAVMLAYMSWATMRELK